MNFSIFFRLRPPGRGETAPPPGLLIFKEWWSTIFFSVAQWVSSFVLYFPFNLELRDFFVVYFFEIFEDLFGWLFT